MASAAAIHTHPGRVGGPRDPGRGAALTLPQPAQLLPKPSSCVPPFFSTAPPCTLRTPGTPRVPRWGGRGGGGCRGGARALPCLSFPTELGTVCGAPPSGSDPAGEPPAPSPKTSRPWHLEVLGWPPWCSARSYLGLSKGGWQTPVPQGLAAGTLLCCSKNRGEQTPMGPWRVLAPWVGEDPMGMLQKTG